ncbi:ubiquitin-protein ligase RKR1 [Rhodotorula paludigena]|uniref:ubiquitin-protein ligase RKR1 n=1 Tax=Rhodotorula paludigena TaxID=86838 RepID=UPI0031780DFB
MAPKGKSSTSKATQKKHAAKAAKKHAKLDGDDGGDAPAPAAQPLQRGQKKVKKKDKAARVKQYIPPAKPKGEADPVDVFVVSQGKQLDPALVVVLRSLNKRDEVTLLKACEALDAWVRDTLRADSDGDGEDWERELRQDGVVDAMSVWAHHFPRLALHPSRRLRLQVHSLHALVTAASVRRGQAVHPLLKSTRSALLAPLWLERGDYVGAWCTAAHDTDRAVRREAKASWDAVLVSAQAASEAEDEVEGVQLAEHADSIAAFAFSVVLGGSHGDSGGGPSASGASTPSAAEPDDPAFLRTSALSSLAYLLSSLPAPLPLSTDTLDTLLGEQLWDLVSRAEPGSRTKEQPAMVRRAMYELLEAVVVREEDLLGAPTRAEEEGEADEEDEDGSKLAMIAARVLGNCWNEEDGWPGIVAFLRRYPSAWTLADSILLGDDDADDAQENDEVDSFKSSPSISLFLQHLTLGCSGHPTALYPTILLLLSTLPAPFNPPLPPASFSLLFESFWAAHSSRALAIGGRLALDSFASALLECLAFSLPPAADPSFAAEQARVWVAGRIWRSYLGRATPDAEGAGKPLGPSRKVAQALAQTLDRFAARPDRSVYDALWAAMRDEALAAARGEDEQDVQALVPLGGALRAFCAAKEEIVCEAAKTLVRECVQSALLGVQQGKESARGERLRFVLDVKDLVEGDVEIGQLLDDFARTSLPALLPTSPVALSLFTAHLASSAPDSRAAAWQALFASPPTPSVLLKVVDAVTDAGLAADLPSAEQDERIRTIAGMVLAPEARYDSDELELLRRVVLQPQPLVDTSLPHELVRLAVDAFAGSVDAALLAANPVSSASLEALVAPSALLAHYVQLPDNARAVLALRGAAGALFDLGHVLPNCRLEQQGVDVPGEAVAAAQQAWDSIVEAAGDKAIALAMSRLQGRVLEAKCRPSAIELVGAAAALLEAHPTSMISLVEVLPPRDAINGLYASLSLTLPASSLSILDPLIPTVEDVAPASTGDFDDAFLSPYARVMLALLEVSARDHAILRRSAWALPHLLLLSSVARDELAKPSPPSRSSGLFAPDVPQEILERIVAAAEGASSYLLSSAANALPDGWHASAVAHLRAKERAAPPEGDELLGVLDQLWTAAKAGGAEDAKALHARRAIRTVLSACLRYTDDGGVQDAERWLAMAQNLTSAPDLACAILYAIKPVLLETPRFERYQNELAASLAGVQPSAIDTKGIPALRQLLAVAPPPDAPVIFLPQQRSVFLLQALQRWVSSDEYIPTELKAGIAELFSHLAPIVQDLSGSHWDLMFDQIESNLDAADWEEPYTLPAVYDSCRLLAQIKDLAASNADLRETAKARVDASQELVLALFLARPTSMQRDEPRLLVVEAMARLIKDLPPKLLSMDKSFSQLLRLLQDPAWAVQLSSYNLLRRVVATHVADLVVEVELDAEENVEIKLPSSLTSLLDRRVDDGDEAARTTAYLLAWLATFSFFESSSPRLRASYIEQLRDSGLIVNTLLPSLFHLLSLGDRGRPFDLSPWSIDDFHLELFETSLPESLPVLAAHVYYRALQSVPSVIRSYWTSLQNLTLSRAVQSFTSRHFSPLLVSDELAALRDPSSPVGQQLRDNDDFTVKVAQNASEVKVVFVVDEEQLEIGIKVPSEFPLAGVEVSERRRVGVSDKQFRAWLLGMNQTITAQSAAIADAILLFKRNVQAHFEGVESCAICYSTVSLDRALPTKSCKTCDNKFHASCLYRWFQTSHGSTCPLCRQLM